MQAMELRGVKGGASVVALAEKWKAPIVTGYNGICSVSGEHANMVGLCSRHGGRLVQPNRDIMCIMGYGSLEMLLAGLETTFRINADITIIVNNVLIKKMQLLGNKKFASHKINLRIWVQAQPVGGA